MEKAAMNKTSLLSSSISSKEKRLEELIDEITHFEKQCSVTAQEQIRRIDYLKDQLHFAKRKGDSDIEFVNVWLTARNQHETQVVQRNVILDKRAAIRSIQNQIDTDITAYENVTSWTKHVSSKLQKDIQAWKEKFANGVRDIEQKIEAKKKLLEEQQERMRAIEIQVRNFSNLHPITLYLFHLVYDDCEAKNQFFSCTGFTFVQYR
jgi:uncharacterized protein (DUF342 family)